MSAKPRIRPTNAEEFMARRIQSERETRGWSYRQLSDALRALPSPVRLEIDPSALYKIEVQSAEGRRRRITVDEAVAFAAVFEMTLSEWMLTPEDQAEREGWTRFLEAVEAVNRVRSNSTDYEIAVGYVRKRIELSTELQQRIKDFGDQAEQKIAEELSSWARHNPQRPESDFDEEGFRAFVWANATPAMIATRDALSKGPMTLILPALSTSTPPLATADSPTSGGGRNGASGQ